MCILVYDEEMLTFILKLITQLYHNKFAKHEKFYSATYLNFFYSVTNLKFQVFDTKVRRMKILTSSKSIDR